MSKLNLWLLCSTLTFLSVTGSLFAIPFYAEQYFYIDLDVFPPRGLLMQVHGAASMVFLLVFGAIWQGHAKKRMRNSRNRVTGVLILILFASLALTGYLLYYTGAELVRDYSSLIHTGIGVLTVGFLIAHARQSKKKSRSEISGGLFSPSSYKFTYQNRRNKSEGML